ncbi:MAG: PD40 domain-containing protein [Bryobacterales bacterium]|nr:PD40 domain-containing protein [Bryobacterales bacterium]
MSKGTLFPSEHREVRDAATGARVHQLTAHASINHATYFLQSSFTPDGATLIFVSYRDGNAAQLFEISPFPAGPIRQLTAGPVAIHPFSPAIHPDGSRIFFVRAGGIWVLDRASLAERCLAEFPGAQLGECSLGEGAEWLTAAAKRGSESGIVVGRADGTGWQFHAFPRTVIHPQFHPTEPEWIEFAGDPAPRMHRIRRDGTGLECLYEHGNDEFVVHETFLGHTGDLVYTVWPHRLCRMNWQTRERVTICDFNAWHITPNRAGTQVLCDTNHPDRGLHLIEVATGAQRLLCLSEASSGGSQWKTSRYALAEDFAAARSAAKSGALSWMEVSTDTVYGPQWTHPHPSFSPDETKVVFASDRSGHPQVYVVEIA